MLDAHPEMAIPPETHFVPVAARAGSRRWNALAAFTKSLVKHPMWSDHRIESADFATRLAELREFDPSAGLRLFYKMYAERFQKSRWGDKTPLYLLYMRDIQAVLPEARFVHIVRDGRDVALSNKDLWFGPSSIEEGARWWCHWLSEGRRQARSLNHYLEIRYEDLVMEPAPELAKICKFIELDWDDAMLAYHHQAGKRLSEMYNDIVEGDRVVATGKERSSIHALAEKPPESARCFRWKTEMSDPDEKIFESIAGDWLREFGYETRSAT
jgi:hypothetical protein